MPKRKPPSVKGKYAVYLGRDRVWPHDETLERGLVYEIAILPPDYGYTYYMVRVKTPMGEIYVPYACTADIWEEWMPYQGEVVE